MKEHIYVFISVVYFECEYFFNFMYWFIIYIWWSTFVMGSITRREQRWILVNTWASNTQYVNAQMLNYKM